VTRSERYIAFLLSTLPKLAAKPIYSARWRLPVRRFAVLDAALRRLGDRPGLALEFGVYRGVSLRHTARKMPHRLFYGFDSFAGLPPDGRPDWVVDFKVAAPPAVRRNCALVPGWFRDTIPAFLAEHRGEVAFLNIDCDVYSSAREVLFGLADRLRPGAVLYFDELINYDTFLWNEMLALFEFLEETGYGIDWIAAHRRVRDVEAMLDTYDAGYHPSWRGDVAAGYHRPAAAVLTAANDDLGRLEDPAVAAITARFDAWTLRYEALGGGSAG
jgi:hypothetical protein